MLRSLWLKHCVRYGRHPWRSVMHFKVALQLSTYFSLNEWGKVSSGCWRESSIHYRNRIGQSSDMYNRDRLLPPYPSTSVSGNGAIDSLYSFSSFAISNTSSKERGTSAPTATRRNHFHSRCNAEPSYDTLYCSGSLHIKRFLLPWLWWAFGFELSRSVTNFCQYFVNIFLLSRRTFQALFIRWCRETSKLALIDATGWGRRCLWFSSL